MPVDYPAPIPAPTRRTPLRSLSLAVGFLVTLGLLMAAQHLVDFSGLLS